MAAITVALDFDNPQNNHRIRRRLVVLSAYPDKTVIVGEQQLTEAIEGVCAKKTKTI